MAGDGERIQIARCGEHEAVVNISMAASSLFLAIGDVPVSARPCRGENHGVDDTRESI